MHHKNTPQKKDHFASQRTTLLRKDRLAMSPHPVGKEAKKKDKENGKEEGRS